MTSPKSCAVAVAEARRRHRRIGRGSLASTRQDVGERDVAPRSRMSFDSTNGAAAAPVVIAGLQLSLCGRPRRSTERTNIDTGAGGP